MKYNLNGWGFLKEQPDILNELQKDKCDFLNFDRNTNQLSFLCKNEIVKVYDFSSDLFTLKKNRETSLANFIKDHHKYNCDIISESSWKNNGDKIIQFKAKCGKEQYDTNIDFNLNKLNFSLPIVVDNRIKDDRNKASASFGLLNICRAGIFSRIKPGIVTGKMYCKIGNPVLLYNFNSQTGELQIQSSEIERLLPYLGKYFVIPNTIGKKVIFIKAEKKGNYITTYYRTDRGVIITKGVKGSNLVSDIYLKNESF
ncbi:MAG: hypothetical protein GWP09_03165 [Nitrospiraceae bacterium]|nr:hypothetical protein [Nitrospiraceae bacterium]